jgi:recombination protein RecA
MNALQLPLPISWSPGALTGRLVEMSGRARLTMALGLVLAAQQKREPTAWITNAASSFFPPDAAANGIDLSAMPCVRVDSAMAAARAADLLLRSGAFGLVLLDLGGAEKQELPMPLQSRLVMLAQKHDAAIVCLTEKGEETASLSSLVSLRAEAWREPARETHDPDRRQFACGVRILKDKQRGPGWGHAEILRGPPGLC